MAYFFRRQINSFIQLTRIIIQCDISTTAAYEMSPYGKGGGKWEEALRKKIKRKKQLHIIFRNGCDPFGRPPKI